MCQLRLSWGCPALLQTVISLVQCNSCRLRENRRPGVERSLGGFDYLNQVVTAKIKAARGLMITQKTPQNHLLVFAIPIMETIHLLRRVSQGLRVAAYTFAVCFDFHSWRQLMGRKHGRGVGKAEVLEKSPKKSEGPPVENLLQRAVQILTCANH